MSTLFSPYKSRGVTLRNRIVVSPMCQYSATDGFAGDWHLVHLGSRAVGGAGMVMMEATAVCPEGRITPQCLGIWNPDHLVMLARIAKFIKTYGAVPAIQLAHAGRKASHARPWEGNAAIDPANGGWQTMAPSAIPYKAGEPVPDAMTLQDIDNLVDQFKEAASRAIAAGFEVIELHAAHGYLVHQFLSPLSNHRTDEYGGSFDNRTRLICQVVKTVRAIIPDDCPLWVRISATDWVEGGWTINDSVALCHILKSMGVDLVDCSSGGNSPLQQITLAPLYQVPFAATIKQETGIPTGAVGLITMPQEAEQIIRSGDADLVLLARQMLRDPYFPLHAASELGANIDYWPDQYLRAK